MADAVMYSHLDPEGPGLNFGGSTYGIVQFYNLLVACLVTGYGVGANAKPGQGWLLIHADLPIGFKLQAPDGVYYTFYRGSVFVARGFRPAVQVYISETLNNLADYPPTGQNVRSGPFASSSASANRHWIACSMYQLNQNWSWTLVARGSQVYLSFTTYEGPDGAGGENPSGGNYSGSYGGELFFGNVVFKDKTIPKDGAQNHIVLGGFDYPETHDFSSEMPYSYLNAYGRSRLRSPLTGSIELGSMPSFFAHPNMYTAYSGYKLGIDITPPDFVLEKRPFYESGYVGYLPGLFISTYYIHRRLYEVLRRLDRTTSFGEALRPIDFNGEPIYVIATGYGISIISLKEKYWA